MNDDELRLLIRAAIQRHTGAASAPPDPAVRVTAASTGVEVAMSFGQYRLERAPDDSMCLIEPAVQCNHCGYCKCHGH
jgi:Na+-translocating ferredoxin:NAD+ oxidoreductase RNF subunit RnfB